MFIFFFQYTLTENTPVGSVVYTLKGSDPEGTPVSFTGSGDVLSVHPVSGAVTLVEPLDREVLATLEVIITITGGRSSECGW